MKNTRKLAQTLSALGTLATIGVTAYKFYLSMKEVKALKVRNEKHDRALEDSMDCSDPVTNY